MIELKTANARLRNPDTRQETLAELGDWVRDTCLAFGTGAELAQRVAWHFVAGLDRDIPVDGQVASGKKKR